MAARAGAIESIIDRAAWYPYQRVCGYDSQMKVEETESKFRANAAPAVLTFWVKSEAESDDGPEDDVPGYELKFRHDVAVLDIKSAVREQEGMAESDELSIIYANEFLDEGKTLAAYRQLVDKELQKWPSPYAGVLWVAAQDHPRHSDGKQNYYQNVSAAKNIFHRRHSMV